MKNIIKGLSLAIILCCVGHTRSEQKPNECESKCSPGQEGKVCRSLCNLQSQLDWCLERAEDAKDEETEKHSCRNSYDPQFACQKACEKTEKSWACSEECDRQNELNFCLRSAYADFEKKDCNQRFECKSKCAPGQEGDLCRSKCNAQYNYFDMCLGQYAKSEASCREEYTNEIKLLECNNKCKTDPQELLCNSACNIEFYRDLCLRQKTETNQSCQEEYNRENKKITCKKNCTLNDQICPLVCEQESDLNQCLAISKDDKDKETCREQADKYKKSAQCHAKCKPEDKLCHYACEIQLQKDLCSVGFNKDTAEEQKECQRGWDSKMERFKCQSKCDPDYKKGQPCRYECALQNRLNWCKGYAKENLAKLAKCNTQFEKDKKWLEEVSNCKPGKDGKACRLKLKNPPGDLEPLAQPMARDY